MISVETFLAFAAKWLSPPHSKMTAVVEKPTQKELHSQERSDFRMLDVARPGHKGQNQRAEPSEPASRAGQ